MTSDSYRRDQEFFRECVESEQWQSKKRTMLGKISLLRHHLLMHNSYCNGEVVVAARRWGLISAEESSELLDWIYDGSAGRPDWAH